ncbi:MAG: glycosyltransferase family 2 protein [Acidobacteriaceae bacterium]
MHPTISVAMIARNEEANLPRTLDSIRWVDEIVIIDSGSTDRTPEIAQSYGAKHSFNRDFLGFTPQKNLAIDACTSDWIYLLDADEVIPLELAEEIRHTIEHPRFDAYWQPRLNLFLGRWIRHGGFYPDRKLRLFRRGTARMAGAEPHGSPQCSCPTGKLHHDLLHYAYPSFRQYLTHMNGYSSDGARILLGKRKTSITAAAFIANAILNPVLTFVKNYIFRGGFLDGREGLILHLNHSAYVHWKYVKAWEASRLTSNPSERKGDTEN